MIEGNERKYNKENLYIVNILLDQKAQRKFAKEFILNFLNGSEAETSYLNDAAKAAGISKSTLSRAKTELIKDGKIKYRNEGFGKSKIFFTYATQGEAEV